MRIRKIKHIEPNMSKVIGINDSPNDKDVYSSNVINKILAYSTEEQVIGTWMGKPLYRKVIENTILNTNVNHNISSINEITDLNLMILQKSGLYSPQNSDSLFFGKDYYVVYLETTNLSKYKITVEYTKTTD